MNSVVYLTQLNQLIYEHFSLEEIQTLCLNLYVDYIVENAKDKRVCIWELLLLVGRRGLLPDLIDLLREARPFVEWPVVPNDFQLPEFLTVETAVSAQFDVKGDMVQGDSVAEDKLIIDGVSDESVAAVGEETTSIGPRGVYVSGNVYGNISTGDVINYYITGAQTCFPQFTGAIENFFNYYLGMENKPVPFGGRDQELAQLDNWLAQESTQRLLLVAPAGRGKSALLARWSQKLTAVDNLSVVFMPISLRFNTNQEDNTFVILATRLAHFYKKQIPIDYAKFSPEMWRGLVTEYLREPLPDGHQLLLILDGLDEAAWDVASDLLPLNLPATTRVVASARYLGGEEQSAQPWLSRLGWDRFSGFVKTLELRNLTPSGVRDVLIKTGCLLDELEQNENIVTKLHSLSDGDPLLLELYVNDLWKVGEVEPRLKLEDLDKMQPGYKGYFDNWRKEQKILWRQQYPENPLEDALVNDVLEALSMALGPMSISELRQVLPGQTRSTSLQNAIEPLKRFVIGDGKRQGFIFSHPKLSEYFQDELEEDERVVWQTRYLTWGKQTLANLREGKINPNEVSQYLMRYYGHHLEKANADLSDFLRLVTREWMEVWFEHTRIYAGFLQDVDKTWKQLQKLNCEAAKHKQIVSYIGQEILCVLCHASIASLSSNLSPQLPALLVSNLIWTPQQAVSHVEQIANLLQQTKAFVAFLSDEESKQIFSSQENQTLRNSIVSLALRNLRLLWQKNETDEPELYRLQLAISPFLRSTHIDEACVLAGNVRRSIWRARLLAELLPLIKERGKLAKTIEKLVYACSGIKDDLYSDPNDIGFIVPTFTVIAQNVSLELLSIVLAEVWEAERGNENKESIMKILEHLAWQIKTEEALAFVELLFNYYRLPLIAESIGRFAHRLNSETAYKIALRIKDRFDNEREIFRTAFEMGQSSEGVGMAYVMLALSCQGVKRQKILDILFEYIQFHGKKESPYSEQDLRLFFDLAVGKLSDAEAAKLVRARKFMPEFWQDDRPQLSRYSQEIIAYLGIETIKALFQRCIQLNSTTTYWSISGSPYILPAIAEKLPSEELSLIYKIGSSREQSLGYYGYIRAATQCVDRMPEAVRQDTIQWVLRGWNSDDSLRQAIAPYVTPEMIGDRSSIVKVRTSMAGYLPCKTVQYIVDNFDVSYYGEARGTEILLHFVRYLPQMERKQFLQNMEAELFYIKDEGELKITIKSLEDHSQFIIRQRLKQISRPVLTKMQDSYLLASLQDSEKAINSLYKMEGLGFFDYVISVASVFTPSSLVKSVGKQVSLLRLGKQAHQLIQKSQTELDRLSRELERGIESESQLQKVQLWMLQQMISSRAMWTFYILGKLIFSAILLPVVSIVAVVIIPIIVLLFGGYLVVSIAFRGGKNWLRRLYRKEENDSGQYGNDKVRTYAWESIQSHVEALNNLSESKDREDAFVQIAHQLGDAVRTIVSRDYKEYAANAEEIWSELRSEFVLDALTVLDNYRTYNTGSLESNDYVRAILPAVVLKDKSRLPQLIRHIEKQYEQLHAIQYACLAYFLSDQERLNYLNKSVDAFPYAEMSSYIIPHILTEIADYATPDLVPHLLGWLAKYPVAPALEMLAPKIIKNDAWLAEGFAIAQKIDDSVHGFICSISPSLNHEGLAKAIVFVIQRDLEKEQEASMPALVARWLELPKEEIYFVWQKVLKEMKGYPRSTVLKYLNWFWGVVIQLAGKEHLIDVLKGIVTVWSWWKVTWQEPVERFRGTPG